MKRIHLTQLSDAYCKNGERLKSLGNLPEAFSVCYQGILIIDKAMEAYGTDHQIVETAVSTLSIIISCKNSEDLIEHSIIDIIRKWDKSGEFLSSAIGFRKTVNHFQRKPELESLLPIVAKSIKAFEPGKYYEGKIRNINMSNNYGFIICPELGNIHFSKYSLIDQTQWQNLIKNMRVSFSVTIPLKKSLHAVYMKPL